MEGLSQRDVNDGKTIAGAECRGAQTTTPMACGSELIRGR